uniref:ATP synthase complex subunit 8 n=1 Tax=Apis dorsata TaxID=7462 RepID=A0A0A0N2U6_APIDO|nr:ATP synthase F0 subunit 8 [Apis dorsata]AGI56731.1 ATP synthase F0 subunit 8 [Apis dorsata]ARR27615.1 ATP synthase F0 subunit 8 [Apis dorsata]BBB04317.1 ATP synthase F0 subunit 8 [Apis dorsata]
MPQMMPMNWFMIYLMYLIIFNLFILLINSFLIKLNLKKKKSTKHILMKWNWQW